MKSYPALHYMMMIVGTWHHQQTITPLLHTSVGFKMCVGLSMHVFSSNLLRNPPGGAPHSPRGPCMFLKGTLYTLKGLEQKNAEKQTIAQKAPASRPRTVSHSTPIARSPHDL